MTVILLDVDNTIADFTGAVCREASDIAGREINPLEVTGWHLPTSFGFSQKEAKALYSRISKKGFCLNIEPLAGAVQAVQKLKQLGEVVFVTSPWDSSPYWMHERNQWLQNFHDAEPSAIIYTHKKHLIYGEVIIDDRPLNVVLGERKLRVLIPTQANKTWRNNKGSTVSDPVYISKSWPSIYRAVKEVANAST